jgi:hypothetical protein
MALLLVIHVIVCALGRNSEAPISLWSALASVDESRAIKRRKPLALGAHRPMDVAYFLVMTTGKVPFKQE